MSQSTTMVVEHTQSERIDRIRSCCSEFAAALPKDDLQTKETWTSSPPHGATSANEDDTKDSTAQSQTANALNSPASATTDAIQTHLEIEVQEGKIEVDEVEIRSTKTDTSQADTGEADAILEAQAIGSSKVDNTDLLNNSDCPSHVIEPPTESYIPISSSWTDHKEKTILGPYNYITSQPGKEFRTRLLEAFNSWLQVPPESFTCIVNVIRMLHNASLLVDDIQDNSERRRGRPVAHSVFGVAQTINSANFVYFLALAELKNLTHFKEAIDIFTTEMLALHRGQGMDLFWRDTLTCPTEDDYLEMVSNKTGGLFRLALKLMQAESQSGVDCMPFVDLLGLIFQITDDYKNLSNTDYIQQKGYCEDLTEGKFSFPVVHSIRSEPTNQELLHILKQKPTDIQIKRHAVECMERTGSFMYTRKRVDALLSRAKLLAIDLDTKCGSRNVDPIFALVAKVAHI